jgi:integral membrane sensor domain MASE1
VAKGGTVADAEAIASWRRRHAFAVRLAGCFFSVTVATIFIGMAPESNLIWVANGLMLAYLLLAPRRRWAAYVSAGFAAQSIGIFCVGTPWRTGLGLATLNLGEVLIGAALLRRGLKDLPHFTDRGYVLRFLAFAVLLAPLATGLVFVAFHYLGGGKALESDLLKWVTADGLGTAVVTPACVAVFQSRFRKSVDWKRQWIWLAVPALVTVALFSQNKAPLQFLLYPLLLVVLLRLGLGWAALSTLFVAAVGSWYTLHGEGSFALFRGLNSLEPFVVLQIYLAGAMFMLYSVSVVLGKHASTERELRKIAGLHTLVIENSRDAILIVDFDGYPSYVSPAMQAMTGWSPEEMARLGGPSVVHPDDQATVKRVVTE